MVEPLIRHRQTKGAETDMPSLPPPRHISTLPRAAIRARLFDPRGCWSPSLDGIGEEHRVRIYAAQVSWLLCAKYVGAIGRDRDQGAAAIGDETTLR